MNEVKIIIEKSKNFYSSYAENVEGVYGGGATIEEAKISALQAINLLKEVTDSTELPLVLQSEYCVAFHFDCETA